MSAKNILNRTLSEVKKNFIFYLITVIVLISVNTILSRIGLNLINHIVTIVFTPLISLEFYHAIKENRKPKFSNMLDFSNSRVIVVYLIQSIYVALFSLLLIIPGIIKDYAYTLSIKFMDENPELGYNEAIAMSEEAMNGKKMPLFLTYLYIIIPIFIISFIIVSILFLNKNNYDFGDSFVSILSTVFLIFSTIFSIAINPVFFSMFDE